MAIVRVHFCPDNLRRDAFISSNIKEFAKKYIQEKFFNSSHRFVIVENNVDAAEEVFDLSNNPSREDERYDVYGCLRSVSVGDVVEVMNDSGETFHYVCKSVGWDIIEL